MPMVSFLPWFKVQQRQNVNGIDLLPYPATTITYPPDVPAILANYLEKNGRPIREATIIQMPGRNITDDLNNPEMELLNKLRNSLSIAGISTRRIGTHDYVNSENFEIVTQSYPSFPIQHVSISSRMRGGSLWNGFPVNLFRSSCPQHVSTKNNYTLDLNFAIAVMNSIMPTNPNGSWRRFDDSVEGFNFANTDHGRISNFSEFVLMCGAIERLLNCNGKLQTFKNKICHELKSVPSQPVTGCSKALPALVPVPGQNINDPYFVFIGCSNLREIWATDFYKLRNKYAHGDRGPSYQPIWNTEEHLALAAFLFPLLLKIKLVKLNLYTMTLRDLTDFWSFDYLLSRNDLLIPDQNLEMGWSKAKMEAVLNGPPAGMVVP